MKYIHLSDLHLGKRVNEFSMLEEQTAILEQILNIIDQESPDGILIAGDIYDKTIPPTEAVMLFDDFLAKLSARNLQVFIISGNHDSPERIAFGSRIMDASGIHLSPVYNGTVEPFVMNDTYGTVNVYMLPFIKPAHVRRYFEKEEILTYTQAVRTAIQAMNVDSSQRNILITHQFVTGASQCDSEEKSVGGTDNVDADVFDVFDYVALGHIHSAQQCVYEKIRYCGTPLKYSFSEMNDVKSVTVVELGKPNTPPLIRAVPLTPMHDMAELRGTFEKLTDSAYYEDHPCKNHYLRIVLTDENDIPEAVSRLRLIYENLMCLEYDNTRTRMNKEISDPEKTEQLTAFDLFSLFYQEQNGAEMTEEQREYMQKLIEKIEEDIL